MNSGSGGAEPEVVYFSGACHKHFRTLVQAEAFIADWEEMDARIAKAKIERELLCSYRPAKTKGSPAKLSLETGGSNDGDQLSDSLSRIRIK